MKKYKIIHLLFMLLHFTPPPFINKTYDNYKKNNLLNDSYNSKIKQKKFTQPDLISVLGEPVLLYYFCY